MVERADLVRFYVSELRGWPMFMKGGFERHSRPSGREWPPLVCSVHDRPYGHATIAAFDSTQARGNVKRGDEIGAGRTRADRENWARRHAEKLCAELNAKHDAWLASLDRGKPRPATHPARLPSIEAPFRNAAERRYETWLEEIKDHGP